MGPSIPTKESSSTPRPWLRRAYFAINRLAQKAHFRIEFSPSRPLWEVDPEFQSIYRQVDGRTMLGPRASYMLYQGVLATGPVEGDAAEFGVYRGGSAFLILEALSKTAPSRRLYLFDSFRGLPQPDASLDGRRHVQGEYRSDETEVRDFLNKSGSNAWTITKGWLPDCLSNLAAEIGSLSFVHIDVDLYIPVLTTLMFAYNKLSPGGMIFIDDYSNPATPGVARACQEFRRKTGSYPCYLETGQAFVIKGEHSTSGIVVRP